MREIRERIATMMTVRQRGEADARSVRGQKERMTMAAETRELDPGRPREREREREREGSEEERERVRVQKRRERGFRRGEGESCLLYTSPSPRD